MSIEQVQNINYILALGILCLQVFVLAGVAFWYFAKKQVARSILVKCKPWFLPIAFVLVLSASAMTLFYSEVVGYPPCGLCWLQRVFLYPQVLILGVALWRGHRNTAVDYILALSLVGLCIAFYQYYIQMGGADLLPCPASSAVFSDCVRRYVHEFGYITLPFMSLVTFATQLILVKYYRLSTRLSG